jgi:hypothetical protein
MADTTIIDIYDKIKEIKIPNSEPNIIFIKKDGKWVNSGEVK